MEKLIASEEKITRIENGELVEKKEKSESDKEKKEAKLVLIDSLILRKISLEYIGEDTTDIQEEINVIKQQYQNI